MFKLRNYRGVMCHDTKALRKKCPYLELIWSVFSRIWTEYQKIRSIQSKSGKYGPEYASFSFAIYISFFG